MKRYTGDKRYKRDTGEREKRESRDIYEGYNGETRYIRVRRDR